MSYDAVHARDVGLGSKDDREILSYAKREGRVVVACDTDFGELLAKNGDSLPSIIIFRGKQDVRRSERLARLLEVLSVHAAELRSGAILVIEAGRTRIKRLPIRG